MNSALPVVGLDAEGELKGVKTVFFPKVRSWTGPSPIKKKKSVLRYYKASLLLPRDTIDHGRGRSPMKENLVSAVPVDDLLDPGLEPV
ncbi:hypothetical protein COLO4_02256 [Corchorus olitorius]|uniref:Uncharacterized protein n=1 Tax=Corchorus olitorius TaxID=93759 RepID=A0A1R3L1A7_9ROSI|nr:hypothetical protein COLO4_02256 [Corchorus olitorius]